MDRADILYADVVRFIEEIKQLKQTIAVRDDEIRQLKNANKELLDALHECDGAEDDSDETF